MPGRCAIVSIELCDYWKAWAGAAMISYVNAPTYTHSFTLCIEFLILLMDIAKVLVYVNSMSYAQRTKSIAKILTIFIFLFQEHYYSLIQSKTSRLQYFIIVLPFILLRARGDTC